jgi:hypothetical protein
LADEAHDLIHPPGWFDNNDPLTETEQVVTLYQIQAHQKLHESNRVKTVGADKRYQRKDSVPGCRERSHCAARRVEGRYESSGGGLPAPLQSGLPDQPADPKAG